MILWVHFDYKVIFEKEFNALCKLSYLELRKLHTLKEFASIEQKKAFVMSFILSRPDNCNFSFLKLKKNLVGKLQSVQNAAVRFIKSSPPLYAIQ